MREGCETESGREMREKKRDRTRDEKGREKRE